MKISKRVACWFQELEQQKEKLEKEMEFWKKVYNDNMKVSKSDDTDVRKCAEEAKLDIRRKLNKLEEELKEVLTLLNARFANYYSYTDINPYEIVEWVSPLTIRVREMDATETEESKKARHESFVPGGFCGHTDNSVQDWEIQSNNSNPVLTLRKHKDGNWYSCGRRFRLNSKPIMHYDFNF